MSQPPLYTLHDQGAAKEASDWKKSHKSSITLLSGRDRDARGHFQPQPLPALTVLLTSAWVRPAPADVPPAMLHLVTFDADVYANFSHVRFLYEDRASLPPLGLDAPRWFSILGWDKFPHTRLHTLRGLLVR